MERPNVWKIQTDLADWINTERKGRGNGTLYCWVASNSRICLDSELFVYYLQPTTTTEIQLKFFLTILKKD